MQSSNLTSLCPKDTHFRVVRIGEFFENDGTEKGGVPSLCGIISAWRNDGVCLSQEWRVRTAGLYLRHDIFFSNVGFGLPQSFVDYR